MYQPPDHQRKVDEVQAAVRKEVAEGRRPLFRPAPPSLPRSDAVIDQRLAEELEFLRRRLDAVGGALINDPVFAMRYAAALQEIDLINQTLGHLSKVIGTQDKDAAADQVTLGELRARLKRRPVVPIAH